MRKERTTQAPGRKEQEISFPTIQSGVTCFLTGLEASETPLASHFKLNNRNTIGATMKENLKLVNASNFLKKVKQNSL